MTVYACPDHDVCACVCPACGVATVPTHVSTVRACLTCGTDRRVPTTVRIITGRDKPKERTVKRSIGARSDYSHWRYVMPRDGIQRAMDAASNGAHRQARMAVPAWERCADCLRGYAGILADEGLSRATYRDGMARSIHADGTVTWSPVDSVMRERIAARRLSARCRVHAAHADAQDALVRDAGSAAFKPVASAPLHAWRYTGPAHTTARKRIASTSSHRHSRVLAMLVGRRLWTVVDAGTGVVLADRFARHEAIRVIRSAKRLGIPAQLADLRRAPNVVIAIGDEPATTRELMARPVDDNARQSRSIKARSHAEAKYAPERTWNGGAGPLQRVDGSPIEPASETAYKERADRLAESLAASRSKASTGNVEALEQLVAQ